ncbi:MAG TPA: GH3 auxin-responsive promoter family protein [Symbiobacteriaceae bacterium]|nr:GH3 auxin-responsive promoter family protein [Symbiobacteriaceae bacterium]
MNWLTGTGLELMMRGMANSFLRQTERAVPVAAGTLQQILAVNGNTVWGREHGLTGPGAFRDHPVTTYADYAPYIERMAQGEPGVLTGDPVTYFAVTSGTTGPQKLIPVTRRQTRTIMTSMLAPIGLAARAGLIGRIRGRYLQIMTEQISGTTPGGIPRGAATSGGLQSMGKMLGLIWTSPMPVIKVQKQRDARYLHLLFALREERLWALCAFFPSTLIDLLRDLATRAPALLRDLADGTIAADVELPAAVRAELTGLLRPAPDRARRLGALVEQGRLTVRDVWPETGVVLTAGSGAFRFYVEQLQPFLGGVPVFSPVYAASEAAIGIGLPGRPGYVIVPGAAYHEFLPVGGDRPLGFAEVEEGAEYEILLTTYAGLWRYRLGDLVRVVGRCGHAPVVEFLERKGQVLSIQGEKVSEAQVVAAFSAACQATGASVVDYVVTPDPSVSPGRYRLLVEARGETGALLEAFDARLREAVPSYGRAVSLGKLSPMAVGVLKPGAFECYREMRIAAGASASQVKVPHVIVDPAVAQRDFGTHLGQ